MKDIDIGYQWICSIVLGRTLDALLAVTEQSIKYEKGFTSFRPTSENLLHSRIYS